MGGARRLALAAAAAALLLAPASLAPASLAAEASCGEVETTPDEGHQHLLGDAAPPVGYASTPPASGWHYRERGRVRLGVAPPTEPLSEPEQVTVLAVGGVVIGYGDLAEVDVRALEGVVAGAGTRPVALTPYEALEPGEVALSAWRTVQRCDGVDLGAVEAFVEERAAARPDFTMSAGGDHAGHDPAATGPGGERSGALPPEVLIATGLLLLWGFAAAVRRALRPRPAGAARQPRQRPVRSRS